MTPIFGVVSLARETQMECQAAGFNLVQTWLLHVNLGSESGDTRSLIILLPLKYMKIEKCLI